MVSKTKKINRLELIGLFYEAAIEPSLWEKALDSIRDVIPAAGMYALTFEPEIKQQRPSTLTNDLDPSVNQQYLDERIIEVCPKYKNITSADNYSATFDYQHSSESEISKHPAYQLPIKGWNTRYYMGIKFPINSSLTTYITLQRTKKQGHVNKEEAKLFEFLSHHIQRAMQITETLQIQHSAIKFGLEFLESKNHGLFVLDQIGAVIYSNNKAQNILKRNDAFVITKNNNLKTLGTINEKFQSILTNSINEFYSISTSNGGALQVPGRSGDRNYFVVVSPLSSNSVILPLRQPSCMVIIKDPDERPLLYKEFVAELFNLTKKESSLAVLIADGVSLDDAAQQLNIAKNTAKHHLRNIFSKTETSSQTELASLLLHSIPH
jgi:DNA-binding CsgD family transcriptional regulator